MALPPPIADYLADLDAELTGPGRARRDLLAEARDHLVDASEAYAAGGYDDREAAALAVADFGGLDEIAPAFQTTLALAAARRTAWLLVAVLGIQPFLWDSGLRLAARVESSAPDTPVYAVLSEGVEVLGAVMIAGAVASLVLTGVGRRWVPAGRGIARLTAWFTLTTCALTPVLVLSLTGMTGQLESGAMWMSIGTLQLAPLAAVSQAARRTLAAC